MNQVTGRCFCGSIEFEVAGPEKFACFCYCASCQRAAGAPVVPWATYDKNTFNVIKGAIHWHHSSPGVTRGQCNNCGTSITYETEKRPGEIDLTLNSLDDPSGPTLKAHIFTEDKQPWIRIDDELPVYEKNVV